MRTVPHLLCGVLVAAFLFSFPFPSGLRADSFSVDGKTIEGEMVDVVLEGVFVATGTVSGEVIPWDKLSSFQAKDVRIELINQLRNLRCGAVWIVGTVREVLPQGAVIYADARPRANYGASLNMPARDPNQAKPRGSRSGGKSVSGWYLVADLPDAEKLVDETVQLIAYPNGNIEEIQLASENDAEKIPTTTLALPLWAGVRPWTNLDGMTIEAELIYVENGKCIFEKDGQTVVYPMVKLIEEHQELARNCEDLAKAVFIDPAVRE